MKKILILFAMVALVIAFTGCDDWLDLKPESEVVLEDFWQNETQVNEVLASCYRGMIDDGYMERMMIWGEVRSDNVTYGNSIKERDLSKMMNVDITTGNQYCNWGAVYAVINYCNTFLYYAPTVLDKDPNFTVSKLRVLEAEVLTIRALAYFQLVRTFKEVPWITTPSINDAQNYLVAKSTEDEILDNIVRDIKQAQLYARKDFPSVQETKGRITLNATWALLADIYLWRNDYENCIDACNRILADKSLELVDSDLFLYNVFYKGNSTESIFELQFTDEKIQNNNRVREYYGYSSNPLGQWSFPLSVAVGIDGPFKYNTSAGVEGSKDMRLKQFLFNSTGSDMFFVFKYAGVDAWENSSGGYNYSYRYTLGNWIVYRLADIMLMKAEALAQLNRGQNDLDEVMKLVNTTYLRSNPKLLGDSLRLESYPSLLDVQNLVMRERQRELMFEGKRWYDLMRLARRANSPDPLLGYVLGKFTGNSSLQASKMSTMDALYLPIHNSEIEANPLLVQNPFYDISNSSSSSK